MKTNSRLDKITHGMLCIADVILVLVLGALFAGTIYLLMEAMSDVNGGGWLLFIMLIIGFITYTLIASWVIKCVLGIVALVCYHKNYLMAYHILGIIYCVMSILESCFVCAYLCGFFADVVEVFLIGMAVMLVSILYFIGLLILYIISICKAGRNKKDKIELS